MTLSFGAGAEPHALGHRVRALREGLDLSLRELAERSGVSTAMISQVERGETSPTLVVAARIAGGLELMLSQLLRIDEGEPVTIVRAGDRMRVESKRTGHSYELLTPALPGQRVEVAEHRLEANGVTGASEDPPVHEPGSRETATVKSGSIRLTIDGKVHDLKSGDTVTFDADLPHHFENVGSSEAVFTAVVTAGLRRG